MSDDHEPRAQKLLTGLVSPETAAKMEAESQTWIIRCPYCGYEQSVWATGGVRYKASGNSRQLRRCPQCKRMSWHSIYRRSELSAAVAPVPPLAPSARRPWLWALGLGGLVAVVALFVGALILGIGTLTQPVVSSGDRFMTTLQTGDYAQAYALCTPALQQQLGGVHQLITLVQNHQPGHWNWTNRSIRNGVGNLDGALTYADGTAGTVQLTLQQVSGAWDIAAFRLNPR